MGKGWGDTLMPIMVRVRGQDKAPVTICYLEDRNEVETQYKCIVGLYYDVTGQVQDFRRMIQVLQSCNNSEFGPNSNSDRSGRQRKKRGSGGSYRGIRSPGRLRGLLYGVQLQSGLTDLKADPLYRLWNRHSNLLTAS